jgi:hypothetical protein
VKSRKQLYETYGYDIRLLASHLFENWAGANDIDNTLNTKSQKTIDASEIFFQVVDQNAQQIGQKGNLNG